jgi:hypothetical protein
MALAIKPRIVLTRLLGALVRWDHRLSASLKDKVDKILACIASVSNHILTRKAISHFNGLSAIVTLTSRQTHPQGIAQAIGAHMNLGAEATTTASQRLVIRFLTFFVRLLHTDEHELSCCPAEGSPCLGLGQSVQTSLAKRQLHTSAKSACKHYSSFRKRWATIATVPRSAVSTVLLLRSVGTFALTLSRCRYILGETSRFFAIVRQLIVSSCGYYATNVNVT